jgi:hypothetical protein
MPGFKETSFGDRLNTAATAKRVQLEKARAKALDSKQGFTERQAARQAMSAEQSTRSAEKKAARMALEAREAEIRDADQARRTLALEAEKAARDAELKEKAAQKIDRESKNKLARDARYAARKARRR